MKVERLVDRLRVTGTYREDGTELGAIPGGRWSKKLLCWEYPASPFTAYRLREFSRRSSFRWDCDNGTRDLLEEFAVIRGASAWKKEKGLTAIEEAALAGNLFHTTTKPWRHQAAANAFATDLPACYLALDMGTGKTLVAINQILEHGAMKVLVLAPKSVLDVWVDEIHRHAAEAGMLVHILSKPSSAEKADELQWVWARADAEHRPLVVIINYESAWRAQLGEVILRKRWDMVIADEAHKLKTPSGKASKWAYKLGKQAERKLALSGTPLPNNQLDIFGQMRFLDPGIFGTNYTRFRARYARMGGYGGYQITGWIHEEEYRKLLDLVTFRVDKSVLQLPETMDVKRYATFDPEKSGGKVYRDLEESFVADVRSGTVTASNALTRLLRLQQVTSGFVGTEEGVEEPLGAEKEELLEEVLSGIDPSEKVVVFCRFRHDLGVVRSLAEKMSRRYGELSGTDKNLEGGRIPDHVDILGTQIQAGGLGVNLIAARYCIFYSLGFSLAEYEQARARVHRGGQTRNVMYIHLIMKGTVDEKVYEALAAKKDAVEEIMTYIKRGEA